ncbi:hypothetical protein DO65_4945 [Burkholderia pseudomallei]|nr:hypothetical protein DO65_4945 [Burkholderia pseudomallei]
MPQAIERRDHVPVVAIRARGDVDVLRAPNRRQQMARVAVRAHVLSPERVAIDRVRRRRGRARLPSQPHAVRRALRAQRLRARRRVAAERGHRGHERRARIPGAVQARRRAEPVRAHILRREVDVALHLGRGEIERQMAAQLVGIGPAGRLIRRADLVRRLPDVQVRVAPAHFVGPPRHDLVVIGGREAPRPVRLRNDIVDPALAHPAARVRVKVVVGLHRSRRPRALRIGRRIAPDRERRDPELHPRFRGLDALSERFDETIDVVATPVGERRETRAVLRISRGVVERRARDRVRVEIIVEMHGVDIVAGDRVHDRVDDERARGGHAGVVIQLAAVADHPVRMRARRMRGDERVEPVVHRDAVRIEPCVQLEIAPMRFGDGERERIVAGIAALRARQIFRPRLERRRPECVRGRPNLQDHRVAVHPDRVVEPRAQLGLLRGGRQARARRPVEVDHRGDPGAAELTLGHRLVRPARDFGHGLRR